jgi:hypothetical protein
VYIVRHTRTPRESALRRSQKSGDRVNDEETPMARAFEVVVAAGLCWMSASIAPAAGPTEPAPGVPAAGVLSVEPAEDDELAAKDLEETVEIKITLDPARETALVAALGLADERGNARDIWFYDTPALQLFETGLVLRARVKGRDKADATVKVRPLDRRRVDISWFELGGFKCEEDRVGERRVPSCSLTEDQQGDVVRAAASGEPQVRKLFSKDQERFFAEFGGRGVGWEPLVPLGPIPSLAWKVRTRFFEAPLVVEAWRLDGAEAVLELSVRAAADEADGVSTALGAYLERLGFQAQPLQDAKTRTALARLTRERATTPPR